MNATITCVSDIERRHRGHWFEPGARRFFASRIGETVYRGPVDGWFYFVSSERFVPRAVGLQGGPRAYSVRLYRADADRIDTVGEFMGWPTRRAAHSEATRLSGCVGRCQRLGCHAPASKLNWRDSLISCGDHEEDRWLTEEGVAHSYLEALQDGEES